MHFNPNHNEKSIEIDLKAILFIHRYTIKLLCIFRSICKSNTQTSEKQNRKEQEMKKKANTNYAYSSLLEGNI